MNIRIYYRDSSNYLRHKDYNGVESVSEAFNKNDTYHFHKNIFRIVDWNYIDEKGNIITYEEARLKN